MQIGRWSQSVAALGCGLILAASPAVAQDRHFMSADDARRWLVRELIGTEPGQLLAYLSGDAPRSVDVMRAYVALGLPLDKGSGPDGLPPLTLITRSCVGNEMAPLTTAVLVQAGANPSLPAPDGDKTTPLMEAVACPAVLEAMLARKPSLSVVDAQGRTVLHHALSFGEPRERAVQLVLAAGFDLTKYRASLLKEYGSDPALRALLEGRPTSATPAPTAPPASNGLDWKALGPYHAHTPREAAATLARPGADTTVDAHFWDGITNREPQRLAVALQAGANVMQRRAGNDYTPLMTMSDHCDDKDSAAQVSIAEQLVAAKADVTGVDARKSNALMIGASRCPLPVLQVLIAAGVPVNGVDVSGNTALKLAIFAGRADLVAALIDAGLDPRKEPYNADRLAAGNKDVQQALKRRPRK